MASFNLGNSTLRFRCMNSVAAGVTIQNGTHVDMQGFDSVEFVALFGALTAGQITYLKVQGGNVSDDSDMADLAGTRTPVTNMADTDSNKTLSIDVVRPNFRYIRPVIVRGTQNAAIDGVIAVQYNCHKDPVPDATTSSAQKTVVSPAAGTP